MKRHSFYFELSLQVLISGLLVSVSLVCVMGLFFVSTLLFQNDIPGGKFFAILFICLFSIPFFVLLRGTFRMFRARLQYLKTHSSHYGDRVTKVQARCMFSIFGFGFRTPLELNFQFLGENRRVDVCQTSPGFWLASVGEDDVLEGEILDRNGQPYLFRNQQYRIWLDPHLLQNKADSSIGKVIEKLERTVKDLRSKQNSDR